MCFFFDKEELLSALGSPPSSVKKFRMDPSELDEGLRYERLDQEGENSVVDTT